MKVTLEGGLTVNIPSHELLRPLRGLDSQGQPAVDPNFSELAVYSSEAVEDSSVLGKVLLSQLHLVVDYERMQFRLAKQNQEAGTPLVKSTADCPSPPITKADKGLIAVGTVFAFLLCAALGFAIWRCCIRKPPAEETPQSKDPRPTNVRYGQAFP